MISRHFCVYNNPIRPKGDEKMKFEMYHSCIAVLNMDKSLEFYKEALGLEVVRTKEAEDGSWRLAFLGHEGCSRQA